MTFPLLPLLLLPWFLLLLVAVVQLLRRGPRLASHAPLREDQPLVSIIVPARNEAENLGVCLATLLDSSYSNYELILVDDRSEDGTREIGGVLAARSNGRLELLDGKPLPDGWLGKPWACWQGYGRARGELLLFTDADTRHGTDLLGRAVSALYAERADLLTVLPRQLMASFWERLVMPQVFQLIWFRYPDPARVNRTRNPRDVVANGQFLLFRRNAYEALGGHQAVRGDVIEDLGLAQHTVAAGRRLFIANAESMMETRMYRSLGGLTEGWSKNVAIGARRTVPAWLSPVAPWLLVLFVAAVWLLPVSVLLAAPWFRPTPLVLAWSVGATGLSLLFWLLVHLRLKAGASFALLYPLGAAVATAILAISAWRGDRIRWKGRTYEVAASRVAAPR
jgi:chlorobactene glucosyltransferase